MNLSFLDLLVIAAYLGIVVWLGIWSGKTQKNTRDYFLGSKIIPWWAMMISIVATETSALTFIGIPSMAYGSDFTFLQLSFGYIIARCIVSFTLLKRYYEYDVTTAYGYLTYRFNPQVKNVTSIIFLIVQALGNGVRVFAIALVLEVITGYSLISILIVICGVTIIYTILGGMKAVIWTDVLQAGILITGGIVSVVLLLVKLPFSFSDLVSNPIIAEKLTLFNFSTSLSTPYTFWACVLGGAFFGMASHGTDQVMVQRLLTCASIKQSQKALIVSGFVVAVQFFLFLFVGILLYAFYHLLPHHGQVIPDNPDKIFPYFISQEFPIGLAGLVIAGVLSAAMSTLSGALNAFSATTIAELYVPYMKKERSNSQLLNLSRFATFAWGVAMIGIAYMARNWGQVLEAGLTIASFVYGGMLGVFLLGLFFPHVSSRDAIIGIAAGVLSVVLTASYTTVAWPWFAMIGTGATISTALVVSLMFPKTIKQ